ncbi:MAG: Na(+)/H(+) antiporter subunit E1 [Candidatus Scalindua rubra]|uniref:Na(+)/H(+) antiporter subunit E1 n=1 Tax=Candidatus Scalindua rubra TaxID=1872076 RepID=A0A1E3XCJ4_9BACT|nr:MAG: Na(+)/H(+) antiporter subunit E1 [Candidatus Scalindua rubra]
MSFLITVVTMFSFWILLSGEFTFILITSGIVASLIVAYLSHDVFIGKADIKVETGRVLRFIKYLPWLLWEIILANVEVAYLVLSPKMLIDPQLVPFKTELKTDLGIVTLANSITLTPGTVTVEANKEEFIIHAIWQKSAEGIISGEMQRKVRDIEGEESV